MNASFFTCDHSNVLVPHGYHVIHDFVSTFFIIYYNRRIILRFCVAICHTGRNCKIFRKAFQSSFMRSHVYDSIHLLGNQFLCFPPYHLKKFLIAIIAVSEFLI